MYNINIDRSITKVHYTSDIKKCEALSREKEKKTNKINKKNFFFIFNFYFNWGYTYGCQTAKTSEWTGITNPQVEMINST